MKVFYFIIFILSITVLSCGPSEEQIKNREQAIIDSIREQDSIRAQIGRIAEWKKDLNDYISERKKLLKARKEDKKSAEVEMEKIKSFTFGRTASEKERQMKSQMDWQEQIEKDIKTIELELKLYQKFLEEMKIEGLKFNTLSECIGHWNNLVEKYNQIQKEIESTISEFE